MSDRTREEIIKELFFYIHYDLPQEALEEWIESLPDSERQIVFDEVSRMTGIIRQWWEDLFKPAIEDAMCAFNDFLDGLSPEAIEVLKQLSSDKKASNG